MTRWFLRDYFVVHVFIRQAIQIFCAEIIIYFIIWSNKYCLIRILIIPYIHGRLRSLRFNESPVLWTILIVENVLNSGCACSRSDILLLIPRSNKSTLCHVLKEKHEIYSVCQGHNIKPKQGEYRVDLKHTRIFSFKNVDCDHNVNNVIT